MPQTAIRCIHKPNYCSKLWGLYFLKHPFLAKLSYFENFMLFHVSFLLCLKINQKTFDYFNSLNESLQSMTAGKIWKKLIKNFVFVLKIEMANTGPLASVFATFYISIPEFTTYFYFLWNVANQGHHGEMRCK